MRVTDDYTFFWRENLSQWDMTPFHDNEGNEYSCAEQYMMSKKALLFGDEEINKLIMDAKHPREQKALGRKVRGFNPEIWNANATTIVYQGNMYKFEQNAKLLVSLIATRGTILVEASPYDKIWGIGLAEDDDRCLNQETWQGVNWLGYTLTNLRDNYFKV